MKLCPNCKNIYDNKDSSTNFCPYCGEKYSDYNTDTNKIDLFEFDHYENKRKYILSIALYFAIFYHNTYILENINSMIVCICN